MSYCRQVSLTVMFKFKRVAKRPCKMYNCFQSFASLFYCSVIMAYDFGFQKVIGKELRFFKIPVNSFNVDNLEVLVAKNVRKVWGVGFKLHVECDQSSKTHSFLFIF